MSSYRIEFPNNSISQILDTNYKRCLCLIGCLTFCTETCLCSTSSKVSTLGSGRWLRVGVGESVGARGGRSNGVRARGGGADGGADGAGADGRAKDSCISGIA